MVTTTDVSVEKYLTTVYEPDCDFVDGEVIDRNVGEYDHSTIQCIIMIALARAAEKLAIRIKPELRIRVSATRYRVQDILVMRKTQRSEPVLTSPPFLCIEIVSPEDRISRITDKVKDYLRFGVEYIWVIDPQTETAWQHTASKSIQVNDFLTTQGPDLVISVCELFSKMREDRSNPA